MTGIKFLMIMGHFTFFLLLSPWVRIKKEIQSIEIRTNYTSISNKILKKFTFHREIGEVQKLQNALYYGSCFSKMKRQLSSIKLNV